MIKFFPSHLNIIIPFMIYHLLLCALFCLKNQYFKKKEYFSESFKFLSYFILYFLLLFMIIFRLLNLLIFNQFFLILYSYFFLLLFSLFSPIFFPIFYISFRLFFAYFFTTISPFLIYINPQPFP